MKQYFQYLLSGLVVIYPLLLVWGFSAGPANMLPIITLWASLCLILIASNVSLFSRKAGAVIGLVCLLLVLPWSVMMVVEEITRLSGFHWPLLLLSLPTAIVCYSIYYSIKHSILNNDLGWNTDDKVKPILRYFLLALPIILVVSWIISIWENLHLLV